jgi:uncharacterized protein (TIGR03437 family)
MRIVTACLLVWLCWSPASGATILKRDGQTITGDIQGRVAIKSKTVTVTYENKQYAAVFYILVDGRSVQNITSTDVTVASGSYTLLTLSWELGTSSGPPSESVILSEAAALPPQGFPIQFGFFSTGAGWAKLRLSSGSSGSVNAIFAYPTTAISSTNAPSLLARPTIGRILGEYTTASAGLIAALQVATPSGAVGLPMAEVVAYQVEISVVVNAASSLAGDVAPGEFVSIYGFALGPLAAVPSSTLQRGLAGVRVTFNGIEAFLTYAGEGQINALVPYSVVGNVDLVVESGGLRSDPLRLRVVPAVPGVFTQQFGTGQAWVVNQDNTFNSSTNAAAKGSIIAFFATGQGLVSPDGVDGEAIQTPKSVRLPVRVAFGGGAPVEPVFAGLIYTGVLQVNVPVPQDSPAGDVELLLTIGTATSRPGVTVAIR